MATLKRKRFTPTQWKLLGLAAPFLVFTILFDYLPLFGWIYSLYDYKPGIPLFKSEFVGLKYFEIIFTENRQLLNAMKNTSVFAALGLLTSPLPIVFAILLTEMRGKFIRKLVQTTSTLPNFISWILVYSVFFMFFSTEGVINELFAMFGWPPQALLTNATVAWYFQTAVAIWKSLGWNSIIFIAAINSIDQEQYQAAEVDGAGRWAKIWHITVPGLMPTYVVLLLISIAGFLGAGGFDQFFVFQNALVKEKLESLDYYVYRVGIMQSSISYATALGMSKSLISVALLLIVNQFAKKVRGQPII